MRLPIAPELELRFPSRRLRFQPDWESSSRHREPEEISVVRVAPWEIDGPLRVYEDGRNCSDEAFYTLRG